MPWTNLFEFFEFGIMAQAGGIGTLPWLLVGVGSGWTFYYTVKHL